MERDDSGDEPISSAEVEAAFPGALAAFIDYCHQFYPHQRPGDSSHPLTLAEIEDGFSLDADGTLRWDGTVNGNNVHWNSETGAWVRNDGKNTWNPETCTWDRDSAKTPAVAESVGGTEPITRDEVDAIFPGAIDALIDQWDDDDRLRAAYGWSRSPVTRAIKTTFSLDDHGRLWVDGSVDGGFKMFWDGAKMAWVTVNPWQWEDPLKYKKYDETMQDDIGKLPLQPGGRALARKKGLKSMTNTKTWDKTTASVNGGDQRLTIKDKHVDQKLGERAELVVQHALKRVEAVDTGKYPDFIEPNRKGRIEKGTHPYADNPAWPKDPGEGSWPDDPETHIKPGGKISSYADLVSSDQYSGVVKKLTRYLGRTPAKNEVMRILMGMQQSVMRVIELEQGHEEELEQAAIEVVLGLPEFEQAREAYESGELKINAKLRPEVELNSTSLDAPEPSPEEQEQLNVAQIADELKAEVNKRRIINLMMQGAAVNKNYAFHLVDQKLNEIHPDLMNLYGICMSGAEFAYWVLPEEMQRMMMGAGQGVGGKARLSFEDGVITINAEAVMFPVLIQEIVKGMMEYIAYDPDEDPDTRNYAQRQADTLGNEPWDIKFGPAVWRQVLRMVGTENQRYTPQIYQHLTSLSPGEFSTTIQGILQGTPAGRKYIADVLAQVKEDAEGGEPAGYGESTRNVLRNVLKNER